MGLVNLNGDSNQAFQPPTSLTSGPQSGINTTPYQMPSMNANTMGTSAPGTTPGGQVDTSPYNPYASSFSPNQPGISAPGTPVFNVLDPKQNPGMTPTQANAARAANGVPLQPAGTTGSGGPGAPAAPGTTPPASLAGVPTGFSKTGPGGQAAPTGMGDLLWDTANNQWVNASAAADRGWWNGQSAGWQAINALPEGSPERIQAAIAYQAAHPNEPMPGQIAGYGGPNQTLQLAGQYGYTWLPQVGGDPVQMAPGLSMANSNLQEYNPNGAPAGSYQVPSSLVHAPQGTGYTDATWLASHGGATGNTPFLNPPNAASATNINNPYTSPGSTGQALLPGQTLGNGTGGGVQQFAPGALGNAGGGQSAPPATSAQSNSNQLDPSLLALLALLSGGGGSQYTQQFNPYGYSQWTPTGGGAAINPYGIQGGGYGQSSNSSSQLNSVMALLAQLTGQGGAGLANSGYGG